MAAGRRQAVFHSLSISEDPAACLVWTSRLAACAAIPKADDLLGKGVSVEMQCPVVEFDTFTGLLKLL